jgi:basic membrane lipoprotein Med (substrate-binding protein (PBP1-ABC) superfamily)
VARSVHDHRFKPAVQWLGMKEGIVSLVWNERLEGQIAPATIAAVESLRQKIVAGSLVVPRGKF